MKSLITAVFLLSSIFAYSQSDSLPKYYSPYGDTSARVLTANMNKLAWHRRCTQVTYMDLNFVDFRIQDYLFTHLKMTPVGEKVFEMKKPEKYIITEYTDMITVAGNKPASLKVKYNVFPSGNNMVINSCDIYGDLYSVVKFYVYFWPTKLQFENMEKEVTAFNYLLQDKVSLIIDRQKNFAKITITNTTINNKDDYWKALTALNQNKK